MIKILQIIFGVMFVFTSQAAYADECTTIGNKVNLSACSTQGEWAWDTTNSSYYLCDGTNNISLKGTTTAGSCAGEPVSKMRYSTTSSKYEYCDGTNWIEFPGHTMLSTCTTAGEMEYDTYYDIVRYCNGTNWIDMSERTGGGVTGKCVFVTDLGFYGGVIGGQAGANTRCDSSKGSLTGTYEAWIGTSNPNDPQSDFTQSATPYIRVDGYQIASNWADLTDGTIDNPISVTTNGTIWLGGAWTNVNTDGTTQDTIDCSDFNSGFVAEDLGRYGSASATNSNWTDAYFNDGFTDNCSGATSTLRLYCFEQ